MIPSIYCSKCMAVFIILLNALLSPVGTLLAVFADTRKTINKNVLGVFLVQLGISYLTYYFHTPHDKNEKKEFNVTFSMVLYLIKYLWGLVHSISIYSFNASRILMEECDHIFHEH